MKTLKTFFVIFCVLFGLGVMNESVQAQELAIAAGLRNTNADPTGSASSGSISADNGMQFGGMAFLELQSQMYFRTGFLYSQRYYSYQAPSETTQIKTTYLDIPLTAMYKFSEYGGVFGGVVMAMNQSKVTEAPSGSGQLTGVSSTILPFTFGVSFKFAPQFGGEFFYEFVSGKISDTVSNTRSLGVNLLIFFE